MREVPDNIREALRTQLWDEADQIHWLSLPSGAKSKQYEAWVKHSAVGGILSRYIDTGSVRVYIKDTLLKDYASLKQGDEIMVCRVLGVSSDLIVKKLKKPSGRILNDQRIICWGRASSWKAILMASFERAYTGKNLKPFAVILTGAAGPYKQDSVRKMIETAAKQLGIEQIKWLDS